MSFFKKDELRLLWPFYIEAIFLSIFIIFPPFYIIYFREILSFFQIGILISALSLSGALFEIPTGAIADIFGRKFSTVLGFLLSGIAVFSIFFFENFYILLLLFFAWGLFETFISGAKDAWIVDLVKSEKRHKLVEQYYIKRQSFQAFALFLSGIAGAFIVKKFGLGIVFPVTGISIIMTAFVLMFAKEYFKKKKQHVKEHFQDLIGHTKKSIRYSYSHKIIFNILLMVSIISFVVAFGGDITWYPLLKNFGLKEHWFGYFFSATFVLSVFIPYSVKPLIKKAGGHVRYIIWVLLAMFILLFSVGLVNHLVMAIVLAVAFFSTWDFFHPARNILFQRFTPSKMRATITSLEGMIFSLGTMISFPLVGIIADNIGVQKTLFVGSFLLIPAIAIIWRIREKK